MSGQSEPTAVIQTVDPAGREATPAAAATAEVDHPDAIATLLAAGASVGSSLKALGQSFGPSLEDVDDAEPLPESSESVAAAGARTPGRRSLTLPAAVGIALLAVLGILALGAAGSVGSPTGAAATDAGGAVVAPSPEAT